MTTEQEIAWNKRQHSMLTLGGTWTIPRSGLILQKTEKGFELINVMPYTPELAMGAAIGMDVPPTAEALKAWQRSDFATIKQRFEMAGLEFTDPRGLLQ